MATAAIIGTDFLGTVSLLPSESGHTDNNSSAGKPVVCNRFREVRTNRPLTTESTWLII
jgi:hypothetical protein